MRFTELDGLGDYFVSFIHGYVTELVGIQTSELKGELKNLRKARSLIGVSLDPGAREPERAHPEDAGLDLFSPEAVKVPARGSALIDTGVHVEIPNGYAGMIKSKSGLNIKHGIISDGVVDAGYTGSIRVKLYNLSGEDYMVELGDKISQLVIVPVVTPSVDIVGEIGGSERGNGGFGSTGR